MMFYAPSSKEMVVPVLRISGAKFRGDHIFVRKLWTTCRNIFFDNMFRIDPEYHAGHFWGLPGFYFSTENDERISICFVHGSIIRLMNHYSDSNRKLHESSRNKHDWRFTAGVWVFHCYWFRCRPTKPYLFGHAVIKCVRPGKWIFRSPGGHPTQSRADPGERSEVWVVAGGRYGSQRVFKISMNGPALGRWWIFETTM